jgi:LPXTG-motif cell wall-anchored protein
MRTENTIDRKLVLFLLASVCLLVGATAAVCGILQVKGEMNVPDGVPNWGKYYVVTVGISLIALAGFLFRKRSKET